MLSTISSPTHSRPLDSSHHSRREAKAGISARHQLLARSLRTPEVQQLEWAIRGFNLEPNGATGCGVALFEVPGDDHLHCNVIHRQQTKAARGWVGPGSLPDGFVYNRRFRNTPPGDVIGHIREMVFAARM